MLGGQIAKCFTRDFYIFFNYLCLSSESIFGTASPSSWLRPSLQFSKLKLFVVLLSARGLYEDHGERRRGPPIKAEEEGESGKRCACSILCQLSLQLPGLRCYFWATSLPTPHLAAALKDKGNEAYARGDYTTAVQLYTDGLAELRDMKPLYTNRAQVRKIFDILCNSANNHFCLSALMMTMTKPLIEEDGLLKSKKKKK